jgi:hypothetical protein
MEAIGQAGPVRALSHRTRRELAATFREGGHNDYAVNAFLTVYGSTLYDFVILMVGPGGWPIVSSRIRCSASPAWRGGCKTKTCSPPGSSRSRAVNAAVIPLSSGGGASGKRCALGQ